MRRRGFEAARAAIVEEQRAGLCVEPDHAEEEAEVSDAGGEEGFLCGGCGARVCEYQKPMSR